jgi:hypothetical protein
MNDVFQVLFALYVQAHIQISAYHHGMGHHKWPIWLVLQSSINDKSIYQTNTGDMGLPGSCNITISHCIYNISNYSNPQRNHLIELTITTDHWQL